MGFFSGEFKEEASKSGSGSLKLEVGTTKIRILGEPAEGYQYNYKNREEGQDKGNPFFKMDDPNVKELRSKLQLVAALPVYDYSGKDIKVWYVTQKNIASALATFEEETGDLTGFDIKVIKTGEGKQTKYVLMPTTPSEFPKEVKEAFAEVTIDMSKIYSNEAPITTD